MLGMAKLQPNGKIAGRYLTGFLAGYAQRFTARRLFAHRFGLHGRSRFARLTFGRHLERIFIDEFCFGEYSRSH